MRASNGAPASCRPSRISLRVRSSRRSSSTPSRRRSVCAIRRAAAALTELVGLVGQVMSRHAEGLVLLEAADNALRRAGDAPTDRATLLTRAAEVLQEAGRKEEALAAADRAVDSWRRAAGGNS